MRYLTADYVFPISQPPIKNGVVVVDDEGRVVAVGSRELAAGSEKSDVGSLMSDASDKPNTEYQPPNTEYRLTTTEYHPGILCPGFINTHCHLELSHMKGAVPEGTGLAGFIKDFIAARKTFSAQEIERGIAAGEQEMLNNGIVAVGDICNVGDTFAQKAQQNLKYYNFIEGFDFFPVNTENELKRVNGVIDELKKAVPEAVYSIVPHAPYSVSDNFFKSTLPPTRKGAVISIHNQESREEDLMFREKSGKIIELFNSVGMDFSDWQASGKSSLQTILGYFTKENNLLLVHNTFSSKEDINAAEEYSKQVYWATCPNANLYIEGQLPDYNLFINAGAKICVGTDSLASNHRLSILDELKTISAHFPEIKLETLLTWATLNGASALGFQQELGSLEPGKKPGILLIENVDTNKLALTKDSSVRRLV